MKIRDVTLQGVPPEDERQTIWAEQAEDGSFVIHAVDAGPMVEAFIGRDDYEYGIRIAAGDMGRLWPHIAAKLVNGTPALTIRALVELCGEAGVEPNFWTWP